MSRILSSEIAPIKRRRALSFRPAAAAADCCGRVRVPAGPSIAGSEESRRQPLRTGFFVGSVGRLSIGNFSRYFGLTFPFGAHVFVCLIGNAPTIFEATC